MTVFYFTTRPLPGLPYTTSVDAASVVQRPEARPAGGERSKHSPHEMAVPAGYGLTAGGR